MELFHYITVLCISEQEAKAFAGAGVKFKEVIRAISGESSVTFEVGEQDPRWNRIVTLLKSLEGNDRLSKENRVRDLSMTTPTMEAALRSAGESVATFNAFKASMDARKWRNGYSGQSVDELLSLEGKYRDFTIALGTDVFFTDGLCRGQRTAYGYAGCRVAWHSGESVDRADIRIESAVQVSARPSYFPTLP